MNLPRKKQIHPELYGRDYSNAKNKDGTDNTFQGVGFVILYPDGRAEAAHFNSAWDVMPGFDHVQEGASSSWWGRGQLISGENDFKFICELP